MKRKSKKKLGRAQDFFLVLAIIIILLGFIVLLNFGEITGFAIFQNKNLTDFNEGTYNNTFFNTSGNFVQLNITGGFTSGDYLSRIFPAPGTAQWINISWFNDTELNQEIGMFSSDNFTGLVGLWHLNETSYSGNANEVIDSSGNGSHGTTDLGVTSSAQGKFGRAAEFHGYTGVTYALNQSSIFLPNDRYNNLTEGTISAWIKISSRANSEQKTIFSTSAWATGFGAWRSWFMVNNSDTLYFDVRTNAGYILQFETVATIPDDTWTHVVVTIDGENNSLYINGQNQTVIYYVGSSVTDAFFQN